MSGIFDFQSLVTFLVSGLAVAICALVLVHHKINVKEIAQLTVSSGALLAIVSKFLPQVLPSVHQGIGLAMGAGLVGL